MAEPAMEREITSAKARANAREARAGKAARHEARPCRNTAPGKHRTSSAEAARRKPAAATEAARAEPAAAEAVAAEAAATEAAAAFDGQSLCRGRRDRAAERQSGDGGDSKLPQSVSHLTTPDSQRAPHRERRSSGGVSCVR